MLVTKTAINVIGEIAKKGYLIINKNCKSDLQNSESLFYLKIFFSKILLTQKNQIATLELQQEMVSKMEGLR